MRALHNKDPKVVYLTSWSYWFSIDRYGESTSPLLWNKLASQGHSSVQCPPPAGDGPPFHIEVKSIYKWTPFY